MKILNLSNNVVKSILVFSMCLILFTGCQSKTATATSAKSPKRNFNAADMKKKMETNITALVTAKTITQSQADKVLAVLSASQMYSGEKTSQNGQTKDKQTVQPKANTGNTPSSQRANPLSKLVTDKVITQAQSDTIMEKVRGNFGRTKSN